MHHQTVRVEHYSAERIPNPNPAGETPWQVYHTVRNAMVRCCRRHGPTGSMGILEFDPSDPTCDFDQWQSGDADPWYDIIDDQYNSERYLYIELCQPDAVTVDWIKSTATTLAEFPGWGMGVANIPDAYLLIFADKLMVHGEPFAKCGTTADVASVAREQLALRDRLAVDSTDCALSETGESDEVLRNRLRELFRTPDGGRTTRDH